MGFPTEHATVQSLWTIDRPATVPSRQFSTVILLVCWMIWKQRNDLVFQRLKPSHPRFWLQCRDEARLWSLRFKQADRFVADVWCYYFPC
ncbi:hypothetical protein SETIT_1G076600v2 [Setaria italica]|uniref:Reverse transcriptase zinc-binding domain-containing protein n=1 Tax=Setaria italica TaxID=4555 RepID=K3Z0L5_SETIT|nr:hypothetical protein SETIT_1G076600v2 [Setaria italica]